MSKFKKILIGFFFTLVVVLAAIAFFLHHLVTKSFPETSGSINLSGLSENVSVYFDEYGVPHISAANEHDLMFAAGYIQAQDRLWQMDMFRRAGQGRLSEILDSSTVKFDKLFRTLGFSSLAESLYKRLHPTSRRILEDYSAGVNLFIDAHRGKYPIEFDMLDYQPEAWTPEHSLIVSRLLAWELNFAWWVDLTYAEISAVVPQEKFKELLSTDQESRATFSETRIDRREIEQFLSLVTSYRDYFGIGPFSSGSNAWVIDSSKSLSGKPILANDPHLIISLPAKWYEMHLSAPGWNVAGVSIPGIPLIVIGQNDSLAWGFTNAMIDDCDFYIEQFDSSRRSTYRFNGNKIRASEREEVIRIGKSDSLVISVFATHHGPVISGIHPTQGHTRHDTIFGGKRISMRWTGFDISDEILGFYRLNRSANSVQFEEGLRELNVPGQSAVYADARGNIGCWIAGRVPIRGKHAGTLPLDGTTDDDEWRGFIPFEKLPKSWNPPERFIVAANQQVGGNAYPYYISTLWEPWHRHDRIKELLGLDKMSAQDFMQFQQDVLNNYGKMLAGHIVRAYTADSTGNEYVKQAIVYLQNWNFRSTPSDIATTIVNLFFVKLLKNTFEDEIGPDVLHDLAYSLTPAYRITEKLLSSEKSAWFDDINSDSVESRDQVIRKSFEETVKELQSVLGPEMKLWQWGKVHSIYFEHPLGRNKPLGLLFNCGPFPAGGCGQTINKGAFRLDGSFSVFASPSMRQIIDLAKPSDAFRVLTLGQSGQPLYTNYDNQVSLWLNGGYRQTTIDWNSIREKGWNNLLMEPE